ncbi:MAG: hypothetical protein COA58_01545 [Bacteroidetes bacterium]|nr:MAG: hypothetical protein COA58_01545 [Bacteroidota bacterium]
MKVCFIYRESRQGGYSIEEVFKNVRDHLPEEIDQIEFRVDGSKSKISNILTLSKIDADVYHITGDCNYLALAIPKNKALLTIHDIGHLENTLSGYKKIIYKLFWWTIPLKRVKCFSSVSRFTKGKIIEVFKWVSEEQVTVIHNPLNSSFVLSPKNSETKQPLSIIQIGSGKHKNLKSLIEAVEGMDVVLTIVSHPNEELEGLMKRKSISYKWLSNLSEGKLIEEYIKSDIVYFASTYEGFGLPIVEGQSLGRPVITSNLCSMPEVAGSGAYLVNPNKINEIKEAILTLKQPEKWSKEVERGLHNIERFRPDLIADQYYNLYKSIVK